MTVAVVEASSFGASPSATGAANATAINAAIASAKANGNANLSIGAGVFEIDSTLVNSGVGITTIGVLEGSETQGSTEGLCVLKWVGGAAPMIDVQSSFHTFTGINLQNNGTATHGIKALGGRLNVDRVHFGQPNGASPFSVASIEIAGANYDRIRRCEFQAGPALKVSGTGTTISVEQFMCDCVAGSGAFFDIEGDLDVLTLREGTFNAQLAMPTFLDMSNIGTHAVSVIRCEGNEFDGNVLAAQITIAKLNNCGVFLFEGNQVSSFGDAANIESPITATNSRVTLRGNVLESIARPLVRTLDAASFVYAYEGNQTLANTRGLIEVNSQSGNLIPAVVSGSSIVIQLDRASPMAHSIHTVSVAVGGSYTTYIGESTDSANKSFPTKGQIFSVLFFNKSGGPIGPLNFNPAQFSLCAALPPPAPGKHTQVTFYWDGAVAQEMLNRGDSA